MTDPSRLDACAAREALRSGRLSVERLARACLDRIAERDTEIRAWTHLDPAQVLAQARELDRAGPGAPGSGPLFGLPVGIKDVILTADMPTQYNSALYRGFHPRIDAACVTVLRAAGALILGKTDTVEFAATGRRALTRNPHDPARTPGGSSSGSAASVADFHVPLALGTQTGGSIIRPASFCGIFAMKPSWGLVGTEGVRQFSTSLDTVGWFARSVGDLELLYDLFDPSTKAHPALAPRAARIAVCRSPFWSDAEAATVAAMQRICDALAAAGATLHEMVLPSPFETLFEAQRTIMQAEAASSFLPEYRARGDALAPVFRGYVEAADRGALCRAYDVAANCRAAFDALARDHDAVLTPSTVGEATEGLASTGSYRFNASWTLLHTPCINVPAGHAANGLPVGLTLTGPRFSDRRLLAAAAMLSACLAA